MFEIDTILSLFVSLLLIYDASNALRAPEHIVNAQPACAKVVLSSKAAGAGGAAGALQPPSTVLICSNYPLGARLASSHPGLWMTIIFFGLMILSVILICIFRLAASRSARRSILETLRFAVMGCLTSTFLCGIETTLLLALPLHARLTLEPLDRPLIRTCMQTGVIAAAVLEPVLLGMEFMCSSRKMILDAEGGIALSDEEPKSSLDIADEKAGLQAPQQDQGKL